MHHLYEKNNKNQVYVIAEISANHGVCLANTQTWLLPH